MAINRPPARRPQPGAILVLLGLPATIACSGTPSSDAPSADAPADPPGQEQAAEATARPVPSGPSLVLVTLDTTRPDHMSAYGYEKPTTPFIESLATGGARFDKAYAVVPLTTPSHASMLTGLYPPRHGIHTNGDAILADEFTTLAEVLNDAGYRTAASVSAFVTQRVWNLDQGFDAYFDDLVGHRGGNSKWSQERPGELVVDDLINWIENPPAEDAGRPFMVWAHFYDPHHPHTAPKELIEKFGRPYDAEINYVDQQVARLSAAADKASGDQGTAWVVVADHAEAFGGEHGEDTHGLYLFDPTMRIPFIIKPAKPLAAGVQVADRVVSNVDVTPTALGLLGFGAPEGIDGVDLSPVLQNKDPGKDGAFMESRTVSERFGFHPEYAYVSGSFKLMDTPNPHLYDIDADPKETANLVGQRLETEAALRTALQDVLKSAVDLDQNAPAPEVYDQLAALGYVGGDMGADADVSIVDAKDQRDIISLLEKTRQVMSAGKPKEAEQAYREILAVHPDISEAQTGLARALMAQRRIDDALAIYEKAVAERADNTVLRLNYANALASANRKEEGVQQMKLILEQVPGDEQAQVGLLRMLSDLGREEMAVKKARAFLEASPNSPALNAQLGVALAKSNQLREAKPHLDLALVDGVPRQFVHRTLAQHATIENDLRSAAAHLRMELEYFPRDHDSRMVLGKILLSAKRYDEAAAELQFVAEATPNDPRGHYLWGQAVFNSGDYELAEQVLAPALIAHPQDAQILLLQANILQKLGQDAQATAMFEEAKVLFKAEQEQRGGPMEDPLKPF